MEHTRQLRTQPTDQFQLRPVTMADLAGAVDLFNSCSQDLFDRDEFDIESIKNEWTSPGFDPRHDARIVERIDGRIIGYVEVWDIAPHVRQYTWARVHPDFRGRRLGTWLLDWAESRARMSIRKAPQGARIAVFNQVHSGNPGAEALLVDRGYQHVRSAFHMEIEMAETPPAPVWPDGLAQGRAIRVRPMQPGEEQAVLDVDIEAFRDHWGSVERPYAQDLERWNHWIEKDANFDPSLWFLAIDGDEIAGISLCSPRSHHDPGMGWVNDLAVRRPWRRRGLGLALLLHSFGEFYRRDILKVGLGVDAQNLTGATRLYEKAGMHVARHYNTYEKQLRAGEELATEDIS